MLKNIFRTKNKLCNTTIRALKPAATLITHFATVDLAAKAWPEAFEMTGKATESMKCKKTLGGRGFVPDPARGAYSSSPNLLQVAGKDEAGCYLSY